tara:strand:- start:118 stop:1005 length:888 start_codon:yes stop_codon:yes gene_type:complete
MPRIAVFGGNGYLASLIKNQNNKKKNYYTFFSRKKTDKNYINFSSYKKNLKILKNYNFIIHLAGPNQNQLKNNKKLIQKKNQITTRICDLCLANNIKLIYLSSMQVYKDYGTKDIPINSRLNLNDLYSKLHYDSEKIILSKFLNHKKKFTILRMGNVFGLNKHYKVRDIEGNLIHSLCFNALKKKNILINNGTIQRTFVPSQIFLQVISLIIKKNLFNNSIENISYKNFNLKEIAYIIQNRLKLLSKINIQIMIENFKHQKIFKTYSNKHFKFNFSNKKIYFEIDQILKCIKKNI